MLKEKLYSEYQKRYEEYTKRRRKVVVLEEKVEQLKDEGEKREAELASQKEISLQNIKQRKQEYRSQLESVEKDGEGSSVFKEYYASKLQEKKILQDTICQLETDSHEKKNKLQKKMDETRFKLEEKKKKSQAKLDSLMTSGDGGPDSFGEYLLKKKLEEDRDSEAAKLASTYDESINKMEQEVKSLDDAFSQLLEQELANVESDPEFVSVYEQLTEKAASNELPQVIVENMAEPVEKLIESNGIESGEDVSSTVYLARSLDDLSLYAPKWLAKAVALLPYILGLALLMFFIFSEVRFTFAVVATNALATFLVWLLCAALGFVILFAIFNKVKGKVAGIIGGIIGAIVGFVIALSWRIVLPYAVTSVVEWIVKLILCILVIIIARKIIRSRQRLLNLLLKVDVFKKAALARQGQVVQEYADCYCVVLKYREVIETLVSRQKLEKSAGLTNEIDRLNKEKREKTEELVKRIDREIAAKVAQEKARAEESRKKFEEQQLKLIQLQDECMLEISAYDTQLQETAAEYDGKIRDTEEKFIKKIGDAMAKKMHLENDMESAQKSLQDKLKQDIEQCDRDAVNEEDRYCALLEETRQEFKDRLQNTWAEIDSMNAEFAPQLREFQDLFDKINNNTVGFDEAKGVLSDYIYLYNSKDEPKQYQAIKHEKKPIVFLYDVKDSANVAASLFEFIKAVLEGIYAINPIDALDVIMTDPVSKARKFEQLASRKLLTIENDIRVLSRSIQDSMRSVAMKGMHIDDYNRRMYEDAEDKVKYLKYKVVIFLVPEEAAAQNTNFFDSDLWGTLGDGKENGFIPIFFISHSDWKNTFDEDSKLNSKFILQLKNSLGNSNGCIYRIDAENTRLLPKTF